MQETNLSGCSCKGGEVEQAFDILVGEGPVLPARFVLKSIISRVGTDFGNMHARRDVQKCFRFRWEPIWVDSACLKLGGLK